jgi:antitoxin (DNA-binding transcriptional repressor) of toxin-antitoxin stability system
MDEIVVGELEFRVNLERYIKEVDAGRTVVVTDGGRPRCRLVPEPVDEIDSLPELVPGDPESRRQRLRAAVAAGLLEWNGEDFAAVSPTAPVNKGPRQVSDVLLEMRD